MAKGHERTIQSVICWSQRLKVDWEKAKGSFGQLYVSRQNASASIESIAYFKEIGQWFWALSQNQTSNFYLNTVWSLLPEPHFLGNYFLGSPLSKDIWRKERSVLQCCNPFVKCHATSFLKDNWDIRAWNRPWRNAKAKNHVWKPRSLVVQEITGGLCLIVSNSFFDLHAPWNRAESKWTNAIPTMISWMRNLSWMIFLALKMLGLAGSNRPGECWTAFLDSLDLPGHVSQIFSEFNWRIFSTEHVWS